MQSDLGDLCRGFRNQRKSLTAWLVLPEKKNQEGSFCWSLDVPWEQKMGIAKSDPPRMRTWQTKFDGCRAWGLSTAAGLDELLDNPTKSWHISGVRVARIPSQQQGDDAVPSENVADSTWDTENHKPNNLARARCNTGEEQMPRIMTCHLDDQSRPNPLGEPRPMFGAPLSRCGWIDHPQIPASLVSPTSPVELSRWS